MKWIIEDINQNKRKADISLDTKKTDMSCHSKSTKSGSETVIEASTLNQLDKFQWKTIGADIDVFGPNASVDDGYLMMQELEAVDVIYEQNSSGGKQVKFKKIEQSDRKAKKTQKKPKNSQKAGASKKSQNIYANEIETNYAVLSDSWHALGIHDKILENLSRLGFSEPTDIQNLAIQKAVLEHKDILGAAETGSGKTLSFAIPIVNWLAERDISQDLGLVGLILTPTRELAIQVRDHIHKICHGTCINLSVLIGGMSMQKQKRILAKRPHIIVATPGRLYQWISDEDRAMKYLSEMHKTLKFFVLDEADRMVEKGHFEDLDKIISFLKPKKVVQEWVSKDGTPQFHENPKTIAIDTVKRQTFVFSATLTKNFEEWSGNASKKGKSIEVDKREMMLKKLMQKLDFHSKPCVIDLTSKQVTARNLVERKISCLKNQKDIILFYLLKKYTGKSIVFVNSIDGIRRLSSILSILKINVISIHAQIEQKKRLKRLDRFRMDKNAVLLASDVAARGLDIPSVDNVIHYQLPRTTDIYVHRSGRTARANNGGISVLLCCPEEIRYYRMICSMLQKVDGLNDFPVDVFLMDKLKPAVNLAIEIDRLQHQIQKKRFNSSWLKKTAEEMDIEIEDEDLLREIQMEEDIVESKPSKKQISGKLNSLKNELKQLLEQPYIEMGMAKELMKSTQDQVKAVLGSKKIKLLDQVGK